MTTPSRKEQYARYQSKPEQRRRNDARKQARRNMVKKYGKAQLAGRDIDHVDRNPRNNSPSNLRISSIASNRSRNGKRNTRTA